MIDRIAYFDQVRQTLFGGAMTQEQVDGQGVILGLWDAEATGTPMSDPRWLAYILATTYVETDKKMWPIEEYGKGQGKDYGTVFYGRGYVQLTWEENYNRASAALSLIDDRDLVAHPQLALDSLIAARIMFRGMAEGWFTGKKLGDYFDAETDDPIGAREIINGHDRDAEIASYHAEFLDALKAGRYA
jgi:putative chitinase